MTGTADTATSSPLDLLGDRALAAFEEGRAGLLVLHRNRQIGQLLLAERAVPYVQVLYRLLLFRRAHELEPLYEDLYEAVRPAQECVLGAAGYGPDVFRADVAQLADWGLVSCRIEVERLRGYRDTRRRKFRYRLAPDALAFLEWLEDRAQSDVCQPAEDARDLLEETGGSLSEVRRLLTVYCGGQAQEGDARRIIYQLEKLRALSIDTADYLGAFNARLRSFATHEYSIAEARDVLRELERFVDGFLRQVHELRGPIGDQVGALQESAVQGAIRGAAGELEAERRRLPSLLRPGGESRDPCGIPLRLWEFFREDGRLDQLCRGIRESAILVWRKLHAHLRELERRSTRLEDLRARCLEMAALPEATVPHGFMRELLAPGVMLYDPRYWDDSERADPPQPRQRAGLADRRPLPPLRPKRRQGGPVVSLDQARLERLGGWVQGALASADLVAGAPLSRGFFASPEDFGQIMDLSKAGLLSGGRRLRRVGYGVTPEPGHLVDVGIDERRLAFHEMTVRREPDHAASSPDAP